MLKSENHVTIQGWMCNELELKGNELLVYALIYGFSQDGESSFFGGRKYIAETFNISLPTVDKALQSLLDKGYIIKHISGDYITTDSYKAELNIVVKKLYGGSKETLHNNTNNNKANKKTISKDIVENFSFGTKQTKKTSMYDKCISEIYNFTDDTKLQGLLVESLNMFLDNSKEAGKPFYTNMFKGKLNALEHISKDTKEQCKIVQQTLDRGWNNFYAVCCDYKKTGNTAKDIEHLSEGLNEKAKKGGIRSGEKF